MILVMLMILMIPDAQYPSQNHSVPRNAGTCCNYLLKFEFLNPWVTVGTNEIRFAYHCFNTQQVLKAVFWATKMKQIALPLFHEGKHMGKH